MTFSVKHSVSVSSDIFEEPSGGVRGTVIAMMPVLDKQKEFRLAHAMLFTDAAPKITLKVPGSVSVDQLTQIGVILKEFELAVQSLDTFKAP